MNVPKYEKLSQREHILKRPDSYIGAIDPITQKTWIIENGVCIKKELTYSPGLCKIFDEIIVNAIDHSVNDSTVTKISINLDIKTGIISVSNNGSGIPIEKHEKEKIYIPELIFGNFLTSSNYDDTQDRVTGGRNGFGAKLTNVYSTSFTIETIDAKNKKHYTQTFTNNMLEKSKPVIKQCTRVGMTKITFLPDYSKFKMKKMTKDQYKIFEKRVYDITACTHEKVSVFLNNEKINIKSFSNYVDLFIGNKKETKRIYEKIIDKNYSWEIIACPSKSFDQVSFVNGICTSDGGTHVEHIVKQICSKIVNVLTLKKNSITIKNNYVKEHLFVFIKSTIINPSFHSQTKDKLQTTVSKFGMKVNISDTFVTNLLKTGIQDQILSLATFKEKGTLKKTDGTKKTKIKIPKLEDAHWAGTHKSQQCTLILTEGDSAKTFAMSGLSIIGKEKYGVFPLRGKLLNVREATAKQLIENEEINALKKIIGLQQDKVYTNTKELRYGSVMFLTDQDVDGSHIKGLGLNFFDTFWNSLLQIPGFFKGFFTPIVKVKKGNEVLVFYTLTDFENWKQSVQNIHQYHIKYYKGLGTNTAKEAKDYFQKFNDHLIEYNWDDASKQSLELAFDKKNADQRKRWLEKYDRNQILEHAQKEVFINEFIHKDLIHFSNADNQRSIPCLYDGLKVSQRKILWACLKRNLTFDKKEIKVSQLAGYVSEHANYHHGEASLMGAIIGLAQNYVGSNNINLLDPVGQFGTRNQNGKDHASPRYIFTKLTQLASSIFNPHDNTLLEYVTDDDGNMCEPNYYIPVLPMVLINGCEGIGTGFSTSCPNFNAKEIVYILKNRLINDLNDIELNPSYNGFNGTIIETTKSNFSIHGKYTQLNSKTIEITELPVGKNCKSFEDYDKLLDALETKGTITDYIKDCTDIKCHFKVTFKDPITETTLKLLKLETKMNTNNIHLFNDEKQIHKYTINEILQEYFEKRLCLYSKRKDYLLDQYNHMYTKVSAKIKFLEMIMSDQLIVYKKPKQQIMKELESHKFPKIENTYDFLLKLPIHSFTQEQLEKLKKESNNWYQQIQDLEKKTNKDLWIIDLQEIEKLL